MKFSCTHSIYWFTLYIGLIGCSTEVEQNASFKDWFKVNFDSEKQNCKPELRSVIITSNDLTINGLAKSMMGDLNVKNGEYKRFSNELIWLTGSSVSISDYSETGAIDDDELLCHSIVNLKSPSTLPWKLKTQGTDKRIFTFSQGVTEVNLPKGFGVPILANTTLSVGNQVLNLERPNLRGKVKFKVKLDLIENSCDLITPLYQQPLFVTKRIGGPVGAYNDPDTLKKSREEGNSEIYCDTGFAKCGITYQEGFNPYQDPFGRQFTGHWQVSTDSIEVLATNVTPMLDLKKDTRIHAISMHVHPHAHSLELLDKTTGQSVFKGKVKYKNENLSRIIELDSYSSEEGVPVYKDHEYQLISTYRNPRKESGITAMATMFLYLAE